MRFTILLVLVFSSGCIDKCLHGVTRCSGEVVEVCNTKGDWEESVDCGGLSKSVSLDFECGEDTDGEHACLLVGDYYYDAGYYDDSGV